MSGHPFVRDPNYKWKIAILDCSECWVKVIGEADTSLVLFESSVVACVMKNPVLDYIDKTL